MTDLHPPIPGTLPSVDGSRVLEVDHQRYLRDGFDIVSIPPTMRDAVSGGVGEIVASLNDAHGLDAIASPDSMSSVVSDFFRHPSVVRMMIGVATCHLPPSWRAETTKLISTEMHLRHPGTKGIPWHQDEAHWSSRDRSLTALWVPIDDVCADNGPLQIVRCSHLDGRLLPSHLTPADDPDFRASMGSTLPTEHTDILTIELQPPQALIFNGYLVHRSLPNRSTRQRRVLIGHYASGSTHTMGWTGPPHNAEDCPSTDNPNVEVLRIGGSMQTSSADPLRIPNGLLRIRPDLRTESS